MLQENWKFYTDWLKAKLKTYFDLLNSGASDEEIEKLENYLGVMLPDDFKILYKLNNGDNKINVENIYMGSFLGFEFLSIDRIISIHSDWKQYTVEDYYGSSFPENCIKIQYTNTNWLPIFADSGGNYVGLDLDPDTKGTYGQIINFGRDEDNKFVIANSLDSFLEFIKTKIQSGQCDDAITEEDDGGFSYGLKPQSHLIDDLKEICGN
jgi:internalin A